jgi:hypothetical protein
MKTQEKTSPVLKPVLIGGTGRSGTTILRHVLTTHPQITAMPVEIRVITDPDGAIDLMNALSLYWSPWVADIAVQRFRTLMYQSMNTNTFLKMVAAFSRILNISSPRYWSARLGATIGVEKYKHIVDEFIAGIVSDYSYGKWVGTPSFIVKPKIWETGPYKREEIASKLSLLFDKLYLATAKTDEVTHWLDDTPYNLVHVKELLCIFPQMRFLHIYRDFRDVVASHKTKRWGGDSVETISRRLNAVLGRWIEIKSSIPDECYMEISLEDFVCNPKITLEHICTFLNISYDTSMEKIPLNKAHSGRYAKDLSPDEIDKISSILEEVGQHYGYSFVQ